MVTPTYGLATRNEEAQYNFFVFDFKNLIFEETHSIRCSERSATIVLLRIHGGYGLRTVDGRWVTTNEVEGLRTQAVHDENVAKARALLLLLEQPRRHPSGHSTGTLVHRIRRIRPEYRDPGNRTLSRDNVPPVHTATLLTRYHAKNRTRPFYPVRPTRPIWVRNSSRKAAFSTISRRSKEFVPSS